MKKSSQNFIRDEKDISRFQPIINLTKFKVSYDFDLVDQELVFDPIYENMVFLMKYSIIILEKLRIFLDRKSKESKGNQLNYLKLELYPISKREKGLVKTLTYRAMFYMAQMRNYLNNMLKKNIITPKFYLMYSKDFPGEYSSLTSMQEDMNILAFEDFIRRNKENLTFISKFFKKNTMKFLTIRSYKRIIEKKYLKSTLLISMAYFKKSIPMRNVLCEFFYYYRAIANIFYIYNPDSATMNHKLRKHNENGNAAVIHSFKVPLEDENLSKIVQINPPEPAKKELVNLKDSLFKKNMLTKLGIGILKEAFLPGLKKKKSVVEGHYVGKIENFFKKGTEKLEQRVKKNEKDLKKLNTLGRNH